MIDLTGGSEEEERTWVSEYRALLGNLGLEETTVRNSLSAGQYIAVVMEIDDGATLELEMTVLRLIAPDDTSDYQYEGQDIQFAGQQDPDSYPINLPESLLRTSIAQSTSPGSWCFLRMVLGTAEPDSAASEEEEQESSEEEEESSEEEEEESSEEEEESSEEGEEESSEEEEDDFWSNL